MNEMNDFIKISKYAGERFDLTQAGGGNSSVKNDDGTMYIKASGVYLSEINENYGFCLVDNNEILKVFDDTKILYETDKRKKDALITEYVSKTNFTKNFRPSIETLLHSLLKKVTLHVHPVQVTAILTRKNPLNLLNEIFSNDEFIFVEYKTPGAELAFELKSKLEKNNKDIIFLQNHGLIITANTLKEVISLLEYVLEKIENYLELDIKKYKLTNELSSYINDNEHYDYISYLSEDNFLINNIDEKLFTTLPLFPDKLVYSGVSALFIKKSPKNEIEDYKNKFYIIPKVLYYKNHLFFVAKNVKKAKEIEDVFKFHIQTILFNKDENLNPLTMSEIEYLENWEAEKYRQKI